MLNLKGELHRERRNALRVSLAEILIGRTVIVIGYGGWDDVVMGALKDALATECNIIWLIKSDDVRFDTERDRIAKALVNRETNNLRFVRGADADRFLSTVADGMNENDKELDLEAENLALTQRLKQLEDDLAVKTSHATTLEKILDGVGAIRSTKESLDRVELFLREKAEQLTGGLAVVASSWSEFSKTTSQFRDDFSEHRGQQKQRLTAIEANLRSITDRGERNGERLAGISTTLESVSTNAFQMRQALDEDRGKQSSRLDNIENIARTLHDRANATDAIAAAANTVTQSRLDTILNASTLSKLPVICLVVTGAAIITALVALLLK